MITFRTQFFLLTIPLKKSILKILPMKIRCNYLIEHTSIKEINIWMQIWANCRVQLHGSAYRTQIIDTYEHFHFSRKPTTFCEWCLQINVLALWNSSITSLNTAVWLVFLFGHHKCRLATQMRHHLFLFIDIILSITRGLSQDVNSRYSETIVVFQTGPIWTNNDKGLIYEQTMAQMRLILWRKSEE